LMSCTKLNLENGELISLKAGESAKEII
jgi:hypothetical protein